MDRLAGERCNRRVQLANTGQKHQEKTIALYYEAGYAIEKERLTNGIRDGDGFVECEPDPNKNISYIPPWMSFEPMITPNTKWSKTLTREELEMVRDLFMNDPAYKNKKFVKMWKYIRQCKISIQAIVDKLWPTKGMYQICGYIYNTFC